MNKKIFTGVSVDECLDNASYELGIDKDKIEYEILEERKGLFRKHASISVNICDNTADAISDTNKLDGTVRIENGNILVKNPLDNGKPAYIASSGNVKLVVDGVEVVGRKEVYVENDIKVIFNTNTDEPLRQYDITISPDKMQAYISIEIIPKCIYTLVDKKESNSALVESKILQKKFPKLFTNDEILKILYNNGVKFGIIKENIEKCLTKESIKNLLIAEGKKVIDDEDDYIEFKADINENKKFFENTEGKVDFKSIGFVKAVKSGDIIAVKHTGKKGSDGCDVTAKIIKKKTGKIVKLRAGQGCMLKDENTVAASINGKPCVKNNTFCVYSVYEVPKDVDLSTGNIKFIGDVVIYGSIKEGMKVEAGNSVTVNKNVELAEIIAKGNVTIRENVIQSQISGGGEDVLCLKQIDNLNEMKTYLKQLIESIEQIKEYNLLGKKCSDGEIIKVLIENKFKRIPDCFRRIKNVFNIEKDEDELTLVEFIKNKLIGFGPLNIKNYNEINSIIELIDKNIDKLNTLLSLPVDVTLNYCQDSKINSSGNIIFTGKGDYISDLTANESIIFQVPDSIARGGTIKAKNEIKARVVGSLAGVSTKLIVEKSGNIYADVVYQNASFIVGNKHYTFDAPAKEVHVYLDKEGQVQVDKFVL